MAGLPDIHPLAAGRGVAAPGTPIKELADAEATTFSSARNNDAGSVDFYTGGP
jgi:hypothetical protein